jgi:hypothetical protein
MERSQAYLQSTVLRSFFQSALCFRAWLFQSHAENPHPAPFSNRAHRFSPPWPPLHFSHNRRKTERGCLPLDSATSTMTNWKNCITYTTQQPRKTPLSKICKAKFLRGAGGEDLPRVKSTDYKIGSNPAYLLTFRARRIARDADVRPQVESRHLPNFNRLWNNPTH